MNGVGTPGNRRLEHVGPRASADRLGEQDLNPPSRWPPSRDGGGDGRRQVVGRIPGRLQRRGDPTSNVKHFRRLLEGSTTFGHPTTGGFRDGDEPGPSQFAIGHVLGADITRGIPRRGGRTDQAGRRLGDLVPDRLEIPSEVRGV